MAKRNQQTVTVGITGRFFLAVSIMILSSIVSVSILYSLTAVYVTNEITRIISSEYEIPAADTAIVLGTASYNGTERNSCLEERVGEAVYLYERGSVSSIIVSGGDEIIRRDQGSFTANEAATMRDIAIEAGVPDEAIFTEPHAESTYENLVFSRQVMDANGMNSAVIVSEAYHLPRALLTAKKVLKPDLYAAAPTGDTECWGIDNYINYHFLREPVAIWYYLVTLKGVW